jgi:hypothetical protein
MTALETYKTIREDITNNQALKELSKLSNTLQKYRKLAETYPDVDKFDMHLAPRIKELFDNLIYTEMLLVELTDAHMLPICMGEEPSLFKDTSRSIFEDKPSVLFR